MKILLTGGCGFIGSHLLDRLIADGNDVTIIDNLSSGNIRNLDVHIKSKCRLKRYDLATKDIIGLAKIMKGHDMVYHLAANSDAGAGNQDTRVDFDNGTLATFNVLDAMRMTGVKKIVFTSSSVVYGNAVQPTPENAVLQPISLYGASKMAAEAQIIAYSAMFGIQSWIFRFANIVGSRAGHGIIHDLILQLKEHPESLTVLGDGTQEKSYLHVSDCLDAVQHAVQYSNMPINIYNLGSRDQITVHSIQELICDELELSPEVHYGTEPRGWNGDVSKFLLDTTKINDLGWKIKYNSEDAIRMAVKELKKELW